MNYSKLRSNSNSNKNNNLNFEPLLTKEKLTKETCKKRFYSTKKNGFTKKLSSENKTAKKKIWNDKLYQGGLFDQKLKRNEIFDSKIQQKNNSAQTNEKKRENEKKTIKEIANKGKLDQDLLNGLICISKNNKKQKDKKTEKIKSKKKLIYYANKWGMTKIDFSKKKRTLKNSNGNINEFDTELNRFIPPFDGEIMNQKINDDLLKTINEYIFEEKTKNPENDKKISLLQNPFKNKKNSEPIEKKQTDEHNKEPLVEIETQLKKLQSTLIPLMKKKHQNENSNAKDIIENAIGRSIKKHCEEVIEFIIDDILEETVNILNRIELLEDQHKKKLKVLKICDIIQFSLKNFEQNKVNMEKEFREINDISKFVIKENELFNLKFEKKENLPDIDLKQTLNLDADIIKRNVTQKVTLEKKAERSNYKEKNFVKATKVIQEEIIEEIFQQIFDGVINLQSDFLLQFVQHELS